MALKSGLSVYCYTPPGATYYGESMVDYSKYVDSLRFTTIQPGGFGTLSCRIAVRDARYQRPELAMFSRIVVMGHGENNVSRALFIGEISDPEIVFDQTGEYWSIQALGIGNALRDDPINVSYFNLTAPAIISDQLTRSNRPTFMPIDQDQSAIFPDNPAATYSPSYMGYSMQDVIGDVCTVTGDYAWGVWAHPTHLDAQGFPTGQLQIHVRNTSTINYQAHIPDIQSWKVSPSAERAYNVITLAYNDPAHNGYNTLTVSDPRLSGTGAQQSAPFRRRRYMQDYSGTNTVNQTQATAIANTYIGEFQNVSNKVQVVLKNCRNAYGQSIPLWTVTADGNISIPGLAQRALVLATTPQATVNQFYIISAEYNESSNGDQTLTLQCDNWYDYAQVRLARLQMQAYNQLTNGTVQASVQSIGSPAVSACGASFSNASAGGTVGVMVSFPSVLAQVPTSVTLTVTASSNASSVTATQLSVYGFLLSWTATAAGASSWRGTYQTVGN